MGEKVGGQQHIHADLDELTPGRSLLAFGGGGKPMAFQDISHGLMIAEAIAQIDVRGCVLSHC